MTTQLTVQRNALSALTEQLGMTDYEELYGILKNTIMPKATNEEMAAFALVCSSYKLNPLTREVYAFPTKTGGIMPMIGIDGWLKIAHQHADYAGMNWVDGVDGDGDRWCECTVFLKSTPDHPVTIREYLSECKQNTPVWAQRPKRMLRHRATIQAIRYALGISGVSDSDDYEEQGLGGSMQMREVVSKVSEPSFLTRSAEAAEAGRLEVAAVFKPNFLRNDAAGMQQVVGTEVPCSEKDEIPGLGDTLPMFGEMIGE
jgi:phage recombination protein Bet